MLVDTEEASIRKKIEYKLEMLKLEKPELFYMTQDEKIGQLAAHILKLFLASLMY